MFLFLLEEEDALSYLSLDLELEVLDIQLQAAPIFINNLINQKAKNIKKAATAKERLCESRIAEAVIPDYWLRPSVLKRMIWKVSSSFGSELATPT